MEEFLLAHSNFESDPLSVGVLFGVIWGIVLVLFEPCSN